MKHTEKGFTAVELFLVLITIVAVVVVVGGYISNIVKLCGCDFATPYKAEVIRIAGIVVPPVGVIVGYLNLGK